MERLTAQEMMHLLDEQLRNAQKIQQKIIPKPNSFKSSYYSFYSYLKPFRRVGGDFFDFQVFDDDCVSLILADATGHGIDAAMLTGMVKLIYSYALQDPVVHRSPSQIIARVDRDIEKMLDFSFFSCVSLLLDPNENKVYWNNAGHPPGFLITQERSVTQLSASLPLIGMHSMFSTINYDDLFFDFSPGDKIILYTDGLTEGKDTQDNLYGIERIESIIHEHKNASIDTLCQVITNDYNDFTQDAEINDDICLLGLQYD